MKLAKATILLALVVSAVLVGASDAAAYPNEAGQYPDGLSRTECVDCHGADEQSLLEPGTDPVLLAGARKGPHGSYSSVTDKCQTCHSLHAAPENGTQLLPAATIEDICESCHDGTGGNGVYGVIKARTGVEPAASHRIGQTNVVPGGDEAGGASTVAFSGADGTLTCSDCHSPHDTGTVGAFVGDRLRSDATSDTAYATATNRLLKQQPTGATEAVAEYGTGWCASCHSGRVDQHDEDSGLMQEHPVAQDDTYYYDRVPVVTGVNATSTELGSLGQSNRGYVMPGPTLSEPTQKTALQDGYAPLCQQCHEDARDVGPSTRKTNPTLTSTAQEFSVTAYGEDASPTDNPRFQTFPHESENADFLVREPEASEPYSLCLNCHSLVHDSNPADDYVMIFEPGQHDDAQVGWPTAAYEVWVDCNICHASDLNAIHAQQCQVCHTSPYDTLGSWSGGCQQGECHTTFHDGTAEAHDPWADSYGGSGQCGYCHTSGIGTPVQSKCANCHTFYSASDTTAPVTSSDAIASYTGAAFIEFSITESGKVGVGTTFYRVDDGDTQVGGSALVSAAGTHTLRFWSVDQAGNVESPSKTATFTVSADTTAPVTTSNAQSTYYYYPATITLTATDSSSMGVKATYYSLDGGPTQTGTKLTVPAPSGTVAHTLQYWSEDWSGNVETTKTANFTVIGGTATMRFTSGPLATGEWIEWLVWKGTRDATPDYTVLQEGPFNGSTDLALPVSATSYWVVASWGTPDEPYDEDVFGAYTLTTPGAVINMGW